MAGLEKNIWNNIPEEWGTGPENQRLQEEKNKKEYSTAEKIQTEKAQNEDTPTEQTEAKPGGGGSINLQIDKPSEDRHKTDKSSEDKPLKESASDKRKKKKSIKEYRKLLDKNKKERANAEIYDKAKRKDRHDFLILGLGLIALIGVIAIACLKVSDGSNQRVYSMIDSGSYATAYQEIKDRYEKGKNVDDSVIYFVESCVENSEYKRAVAALGLLSDQAGSREDFFLGLAKSLISHEKENRLEDVFSFMYNRGGSFAKSADQVTKKLAEE